MKEGMAFGLLSAFVAVVGAYFQQLTIPFFLLLLSMAVDYISGMTKAWIKKELSSKIGLKGLVKKVARLIAVAVGVLVDLEVSVAIANTGVDVEGVYLVALFVIVWITINELISILENLDAIGVPLPNFLMKVVGRLKDKIEKEAEGGAEDA